MQKQKHQVVLIHTSFAVALTLLVAAIPGQAQTYVNIYWLNYHQVIDGFGGSDTMFVGYPMTNNQLELFYGTGTSTVFKTPKIITPPSSVSPY